MQDYRTLMGVALADLPELLDAELPPEAYTQVPGGAELTDIDPNYMRKTLNEIFGLCGLGWGYNYTESGIQNRYTGESGQKAHEGVVTRLEFWYTLVGTDGQQIRCTIPASGGSENRSASYALKGAITNAIGQAASNIGFQESVYLGLRSHKTVKGNKLKAAAPVKAPAMTPPPPKPSANGNGHKPVAVPAAVVEIEEIDDLDDPGEFIIPLGKYAGQRIADQPQTWLEWASTKMDASTPQASDLQRQVRAYLENRKAR